MNSPCEEGVNECNAFLAKRVLRIAQLLTLAENSRLRKSSFFGVRPGHFWSRRVVARTEGVHPLGPEIVARIRPSKKRGFSLSNEDDRCPDKRLQARCFVFRPSISTGQVADGKETDAVAAPREVGRDLFHRVSCFPGHCFSSYWGPRRSFCGAKKEPDPVINCRPQGPQGLNTLVATPHVSTCSDLSRCQMDCCENK